MVTGPNQRLPMHHGPISHVAPKSRQVALPGVKPIPVLPPPPIPREGGWTTDTSPKQWLIGSRMSELKWNIYNTLQNQSWDFSQVQCRHHICRRAGHLENNGNMWIVTILKDRTYIYYIYITYYLYICKCGLYIYTVSQYIFSILHFSQINNW